MVHAKHKTVGSPNEFLQESGRVDNGIFHASSFDLDLRSSSHAGIVVFASACWLAEGDSFV